MKIEERDGFEECSPTDELTDEPFIAQAIRECLKNNDTAGVLQVIETHLETVNKVRAHS